MTEDVKPSLVDELEDLLRKKADTESIKIAMSYVYTIPRINFECSAADAALRIREDIRRELRGLDE